MGKILTQLRSVFNLFRFRISIVWLPKSFIGVKGNMDFKNMDMKWILPANRSPLAVKLYLNISNPILCTYELVMFTIILAGNDERIT